jgi:hypothetical protein
MFGHGPVRAIAADGGPMGRLGRRARLRAAVTPRSLPQVVEPGYDAGYPAHRNRFGTCVSRESTSASVPAGPFTPCIAIRANAT